MAAIALAPSLMAQPSATDADLKARAVAPKATDIEKTANLWALEGKKVRATGWLYDDVNPIKYPRGTNWEVHPVTEIAAVK